MRILKQLSLLFCVLMLASQAHAMLRRVVQIIPRCNSNMFRAAGAGANYLNNGGIPDLTPGQQPPFVGGYQLNPLHLPHVQHYATMPQGGGFPVDDEEEELDGIPTLTGTPTFLEQLQAERTDRYANEGNDEIPEVPSDPLQRAQMDLEIAFAGIGENAPMREIGPVVELFRRHVYVRSRVVNFMGFIDLNPLAQLQFADPAQAFVADALERYLLRHYPDHKSIGPSVFEEALTGFEENPAQFLVGLEVPEITEEYEVD